MQPLDAANGLEANIEIILQRRRMRQQGQESSHSVAGSAGGSSLSSLQNSVASLASSIQDFSRSHAGARLPGSEQSFGRKRHSDSPKLAHLHRQAKEPHSGSAAAWSAGPSTAAAVARDSPGTASGPQAKPNRPAVQNTSTVLNSSHVFDLGLTTLNSACQLLLRGSSAFCQLKPGGTRQSSTPIQTIEIDALEPVFIFLGRGATALCAFWKGPDGEPSAEEAFVIQLCQLTEVRLRAQPQQRGATLITRHFAVDVVFPDSQARDDWAAALLLIRSCLAGALVEAEE